MNIPRRRFLHLVAGAAALPAIVAHRVGGNLPRATGALGRPTGGGWCGGHQRAPDGSVAVGAARPAICHREPAWRGRQHRHRGGRELTGGRLYAPAGRIIQCDQRDALRQAQFNFIRDIAPVAGIMRNPLVMVVNPSFPARTVAEFIAYAKANPGKLNMGSAGNGSPQHMAGELFKMMAGVNMVHVPYRGSAAMLTDLLRGELHVAFDPMLSSIEHIRAGKLRALAVTTATRSEALPDIPTVGEFVPGYELFGMGRHRSTQANAGRDHREAQPRDQRRPCRLPRSRPASPTLAARPLRVRPPTSAKLIAEQTDRWAKVIRAANIKPD